MKPKTMILMVVAVACGLVASYMTSRLLAERNNQPQETKIIVLVAKKKVPQYTTIKKPDDYFELREVTEGPLTAKALKSFEEIQNKRLNKTLGEESVVKIDDLQKKEDMIIDIPPGQRAMAIRVNPECLAGGFVLPGSRVDIICTLRGGEGTSQIILQNMLVMAVDQKANRDDGQNTALGQTCTLAATPEECTRLSLAAQQGELRLTLRSPDDKEKVNNRVTRTADLGRRSPGSDEGVDVGSDPSASPLVLPNVPKDPPSPNPVVETKPEVTKTHTLTIQEGQYVQRAVFAWDEDSQTWRKGQVSHDDEDGPAPARKVAPPPAPAPEAKPEAKPEAAQDEPKSKGRKTK